MNTRLQELIRSFAKSRIDCLLVTKDVNITYLTGFPASESWLLVSPKKSVYITDSRYILEAKEGLKGLRGISVKCFTKSIYATLFESAKALGLKRLGVDESQLTVTQYKALQKNFSPIKMVSANGLVENLREIKDTQEIRLIEKALKIHAQALAQLKRFIKPGISEEKVGEWLADFVKRQKVKFSFPVIIASGPNSCYPHAKVTKRIIGHNELVLVDMGIDVGGYKSDLTRMFFLGKIPKLIWQVNEIVRDAQHRAIEKIQPGVVACEVDLLARNWLAKKGLAKYFGHSLGHGVGLEVHETPRLSQKSNTFF